MGSGLGRVDEALAHRREAAWLVPNEPKYHYNLAMALSAVNHRDEAIDDAVEAHFWVDAAIYLGETILGFVPLTKETSMAIDVLKSARFDGRPAVASLPALERLGAGRHEAYVLRAARLQGTLWEVLIDPL